MSVGRSRPRSKLTDLEALAAQVPDGAFLGLGGFQLNRAPMELVRELVRQGKRDLRTVAVPNPLPLDLFVAVEAVSEAESGFIGFQFEDGFVIAPSIRRAVERGQLRLRDRDVYETIRGLRAAAAAAEADGATPIRPDFCLIHAQAGDPQGNLSLLDPHADVLLARASRRVLATVERLEDRIARPSVSGDLVQSLAVVPGGASPTSCYGHYPRAVSEIREYVRHAAEGRVRQLLNGVGAELVPREPDGRRLEGDQPPPPNWKGGRERARTADRLVVSMARRIADGDVVTTGVASALPMLAVALARETRQIDFTYINCVGAVDPAIPAALPTSVEVELLDRCEATVSLPELFDIARAGGIDLMFFGAAQIDARARINLSCIGPRSAPKVKLAGPAASSSMRSFVSKVVITVSRHSPKTLVDRVDFVSSEAAPGNVETTLITDLALMGLHDGRLRPVSLRDGVTIDEIRAQTGFSIDDAVDEITPEPTEREMLALRELDAQGMRYRIV